MGQNAPRTKIHVQNATRLSLCLAPGTMACLTAVPARVTVASAVRHSRRGAAPAKPAARALWHRAERSVRLRAAEEEVEETQEGETQEDRVQNVMQEFADAGFPSEEGDAQDPVSRTKAMNGAVEDLNNLMDAEVEVLGKAFDLLEQLGIKGLKKPDRGKAAAAAPGEPEE